MKNNITRSVVLLFLLPGIGVLLALWIFYMFLDNTENDADFIDLAGSQRMLSQQIFTTAHMVVVMEHAGQRGKLLDLVEEYELTLNVLESGGVVNELVEMARVPGTVRPYLFALKAIWKETRPVVDNIVMPSLSEIERENSYQILKENTSRLTNASNELISAYKSRTYKLRREVSAILMFCVLVGFVSLYFVVVVVRRYDKERRESECVLERSRERFSLAVKGTNDGIWDWDLASNEIYFSRRWKEMLGYADDDMGNGFDDWRDLVHTNDLGRFLSIWATYMEGEREQFEIEYRLKGKDGSYVWIHCRGLAGRSKEGGSVRLTGSHTDISERIKALEELKAEKVEERRLLDLLQLAQDDLILSEERLRLSLVFANIGTMDWDLNVRANSVYCSDLTAFILGYPQVARYVAVEDYASLVHPDDRKLVYDGLEKAQKDGVRHDYEMRVILHDGTRRWVHVVGDVVRDVSGDVVRMLGVIQDITERKKSEGYLAKTIAELQQANEMLHDAQSQLLQSEKMASIGQLAAGVAHEINNPVGYVTSNIGTLREYLADLFRLLELYERGELKIDDEIIVEAIKAVKEQVDIDYLKKDLVDLLDESEEGVRRVKQIVQDLKDFSHVNEVEWQWADLHKGLDSTLNIVHNELKYKAEVIKDYGYLPQIECIIAQLNQVFMNILVNAAHAIEKRGVITIHTTTDRDGVLIVIEDDGKGMDDQTQARIFDPFYTTKPVGEGTGLGMSLSYNIVQKHGGTITVESQVDKGTEFRIWLPVKQSESKTVDQC
ncbi:hypothetical protein BOW53_01240 [Solemya pervernicosa gill symbiont]|uniref:histidine kinase n=1 Tax=Solemya pervernicosa gill symbiont TaxID=642797 RepID=A0A1T2LAV3_9GAMM|nr:PAS domain-containing protein [Solemya pervernicosa gill symbiont]OOZ42233.1 hypothetical protein BOW53_01240 [Solemya pervernicosa gill symbiont]